LSEPIILAFDKPHFQLKLSESMLKVDLKEGARRDLERLVEANTILRDSLGWVVQTIIPLDVHLEQIEKVDHDSSGKVNIKIPHRRDIHIPLDPLESEKLVNKLNELIPIEKKRALERKQLGQEAHRQEDKSRTEEYKYVRRGP
jgi:hypothetical protein